MGHKETAIGEHIVVVDNVRFNPRNVGIDKTTGKRDRSFEKVVQVTVSSKKRNEQQNRCVASRDDVIRCQRDERDYYETNGEWSSQVLSGSIFYEPEFKVERKATTVSRAKAIDVVGITINEASDPKAAMRALLNEVGAKHPGINVKALIMAMGNDIADEASTVLTPDEPTADEVRETLKDADEFMGIIEKHETANA